MNGPEEDFHWEDKLGIKLNIGTYVGRRVPVASKIHVIKLSGYHREDIRGYDECCYDRPEGELAIVVGDPVS